MVLYNCEGCNFITILKSNYTRHLNTKKHLNNNHKSLSAMVMNTNEHKMNTNEHKMNTNEHKMNTKNMALFKCDFCDETFNTNPSKRRHELHFCKSNESLENKKIYKLEKENKHLETEKKKLEKKIEKLLDKVGTVNNNNTNNIIVVNNYGKENTDYMTVDKIKKLLNRPYDSIQELIKMLHFNSDHPENHNVKITNKKEPFALVWNDPIWELRKKKTVVKDLVDKGYMMIDTTYEDVYDTANPNKKYVNFQNNFENEASNIKHLIEDESEIMIINETKKLDDN
jgi:hypothetical protein